MPFLVITPAWDRILRWEWSGEVCSPIGIGGFRAEALGMPRGEEREAMDALPDFVCFVCFVVGWIQWFGVGVSL
jgi:hypothetical protein